MGAGAGALEFEHMISMILSGSLEDLKQNTSVMSSRRSSPGALRSSALKWFDMGGSFETGLCGGQGSAADGVEQRGVDLAGVGPGDGVRAALDHGELHVVDQ